MRNLQTKDIFSMARLIISLNLKDELKNIANKIEKDSRIEDIGYEIVFTILGKCTEKESEKKIYEFLAGPLEVKPKDIESMELFELVEKIIEIASIDKWKDFLSKASQLIK
ncbi:hypothetical protein NSA50_18550 [Clostridium sp. DSM 100503]|uniref:hypothetical protein n=1 Tax=Clostridium sp. DSM 100503 TaxID=2963282 RepID=UPI00214A4EAF|nr:hypothetical protein [Clostridium sp. DSM 100503]MCR1953004.1 hypothetical protein [Clostridium sp. DSM 100503]